MIPSKSPNHDINRKLVDQYTEIAQLAGALAHEIKNPLSTIRLNMELLGEELDEPETPKEHRTLAKIQIVEQECRRLQALLDDFLNFTKLRRLNREPSDLNQQVKRMLDFFAPKAQESGIELIVYLATDLPSVLLDRETFHGALLNLVLNAQQAMPDGGQLVVRTRASGEQVVLDLIDTGHGMNEKTALHVFDAFFSTKHGGSGLGLPTAKKIIDSHNGTITVQSEVGRGTQFSINLPVLPRLEAANVG